MSSRRIERLEAALRNLIDYLRRLPVHAETYRQAGAAEAILVEESESVPLVGSVVTPVGVHSLGAELVGSRLVVRTQNLDNLNWGLKFRFVSRLYKALVNGIELEMRPRTEIGWERRFDAGQYDGTKDDPSTAVDVNLAHLQTLIDYSRAGIKHNGNCFAPGTSEWALEKLRNDIPEGAEICSVCYAAFSIAGMLKMQKDVVSE